MTKEEFAVKAGKRLSDFSANRQELLRKLGEVISEYEKTAEDILGSSVFFTGEDEPTRKLFWNGEMFT